MVGAQKGSVSLHPLKEIQMLKKLKLACKIILPMLKVIGMLFIPPIVYVAVVVIIGDPVPAMIATMSTTGMYTYIISKF